MAFLSMKEEIKTDFYTFSSPLSQIVGDMFVLIIVVMFYTLGLTLVLGFAAILVMEPESKVMVFELCLIPALLFSAYIRIRSLNWHIRFGKENVRIGALGLKKQIPYNQIFFVSHGTISERLYKEKNGSDKSVTTVSIENNHPGNAKILLPTENGKKCFHNLLKRCPGAAGVDMDGNEYQPQDSSQKTEGMKRLIRFRMIRGYGAIFVGVFCLLLALLGGTGSKAPEYYLRTEILRVLVLLSVPIWIAFGIKTLRRRNSKK